MASGGLWVKGYARVPGLLTGHEFCCPPPSVLVTFLLLWQNNGHKQLQNGRASFGGGLLLAHDSRVQPNLTVIGNRSSRQLLTLCQE